MVETSPNPDKIIPDETFEEEVADPTLLDDWHKRDRNHA
jgi:hypothetical protein